MNLEKPADRRAASRLKIRAPGPAFQEVRYLKLLDPMRAQALWLRISLLSSGNGFRRVSEVWGVYYARREGRDPIKIALKQSHDLRAASLIGASGESLPLLPGALEDQGIRVQDCELTSSHARGSIQSKGRTRSWDLQFTPARPASFEWVPEKLARARLTGVRGITRAADLRVSGTTEIDGEKQAWTAAPGIRGQIIGTSLPHSWVWAQCNTFVNERGDPVEAIFEGISARERLLGLVPTPRLSTFYFLYDGQEYALNTLWDALRSRSHPSLTEWSFQADHGDLSFRGLVRAENREFAGINYEDTDGSLLYGANAELAEMSLSIYRRGKLEKTLKAPGTSAFEVVSRTPNPYVPVLV
jgi:hypothetical protein